MKSIYISCQTLNGSVDISCQLAGNGISNSTDKFFSRNTTMMEPAPVKHWSNRTWTIASGIFRARHFISSQILADLWALENQKV